MNIKTTSLKREVLLSSILLFLFLLTTIKAKANDFVSNSDSSLFTNFVDGTINKNIYQELNKLDEFDSVIKKSRNTLSKNNLKLKSSSIPNKYDDKSGGAYFLKSSKDYMYNGFYDDIALNYNLLLVSKVKLFLFYSSPKLPSSI